MSRVTFKCKKCREDLYTTEEQESKNPLVNVPFHRLPKWIKVQAEECSWTKEKLYCPYCGCRVGIMDFIRESDICVSLLRSKTEVALPPVSGEKSEVFQPDETEESDDDLQSKSENTHLTLVKEDLAFQGDSDDTQLLDQLEAKVTSKRQRNKLRLQRRRRELAIEQRLRKKLKKKQVESKKVSEEPKMNVFAQDMEFNIDDVESRFLCAVCLDVLFDPHHVIPCNHTFCGPCLRRVGSKSPMNSFCPLCRQDIRICRPDPELSKATASEFSKIIAKRKKMERSTGVFSLQLPWRPGWRNLVEGSPMGGNGFDTNGLCAIGFQIVSQVPYYIPGFFFGNFINLLFFVCLVGVVELIPLAIGTMVKVYLWIITRYGQPIPSNKFLRKINFWLFFDEVCLLTEEPPADDECPIQTNFATSGDYFYSLLMVILGTTTFTASSILFEAFPLFRRRGRLHRMFHEPIYNGFYFHEIVAIFWMCVLSLLVSPKLLQLPQMLSQIFHFERLQESPFFGQIIVGLKACAWTVEALAETVTFYRLCTLFMMYVSVVMICDQRRMIWHDQ